MNMTDPTILKTEQQGMPEPMPEKFECELCGKAINEDDKWECAQCETQICPRCAHEIAGFSEKICTEIITDAVTFENKYFATDCLGLWYAQKLAEAEDRLFELTRQRYKEQLAEAEAKVYDQGKLIKELQSDLNERIT